MNNGTFQISRGIQKSEIWYKPADWLKVWIYIISKVNYEDHGSFKRGEGFFNYQNIATECLVKYKTVEKCIKFLKEREQIVTRKSTRGAIINVLNYDKYQLKKNGGGIARVKRGNSEGKVGGTIPNTVIQNTEYIYKIGKPEGNAIVYLFSQLHRLKISQDITEEVFDNFRKWLIDKWKDKLGTYKGVRETFDDYLDYHEANKTKIKVLKLSINTWLTNKYGK